MRLNIKKNFKGAHPALSNQRLISLPCSDLFMKTINVIWSCETLGESRVAREYLRLVSRKDKEVTHSEREILWRELADAEIMLAENANTAKEKITMMIYEKELEIPVGQATCVVPIRINYAHHAAIPEDCESEGFAISPSEPASIEITSIHVFNSIDEEWINAKYLLSFLPQDFWNGLEDEILESHTGGSV